MSEHLVKENHQPGLSLSVESILGRNLFSPCHPKHPLQMQGVTMVQGFSRCKVYLLVLSDWYGQRVLLRRLASFIAWMRPPNGPCAGERVAPTLPSRPL